MLLSEDVQVFNTYPEGRNACFSVLNRPRILVQAVIQRGDTLSLYYSDAQPDSIINKLVVNAPGKGDRLSSLFECIKGDKALIPVMLSGQKALIAVPASALQKNSMGMTANAILDRKDRTSEMDEASLAPKVMSSWLAEEVGFDASASDLRSSILRYSGEGSPQVSSPSLTADLPPGHDEEVHGMSELSRPGPIPRARASSHLTA
jgi:hypothetical protein